MSNTAVAALTGKGTTALHVAAGAGHKACVELLVKDGRIPLNAVATVDNSTALDRATDCHGDVATVIAGTAFGERIGTHDFDPTH